MYSHIKMFACDRKVILSLNCIVQPIITQDSPNLIITSTRTTWILADALTQISDSTRAIYVCSLNRSVYYRAPLSGSIFYRAISRANGLWLADLRLR